MIKYKIPLILIITCFIFSGCGSTIRPNDNDEINSKSTDSVVGDNLYIPEGYKVKLNDMGLTEVAPMPYFRSPFITVAKDASEAQYAVIFREDGLIDKSNLPKSYEEILKILESKGCNVYLPYEKENIHLFEINNKLFWNYGNADKKIYLNLSGEEGDPFIK